MIINFPSLEEGKKALTRKGRVPQAQQRSKYDGQGKASEGSMKSRNCAHLERATGENPSVSVSRSGFPGPPEAPARPEDAP